MIALNLFLTNHIESNKFPIIITVSFFMILLYVAFTYHNYWTEYDGIYFLGVGKEVLAGNGWWGCRNCDYEVKVDEVPRPEDGLCLSCRDLIMNRTEGGVS